MPEFTDVETPGEITNPEARRQAEDPADPFEGHAPLEGLEHLGRHIVDAAGQPSGSPANFERTRGLGAINDDPRAAELARATIAAALAGDASIEG